MCWGRVSRGFYSWIISCRRQHPNHLILVLFLHLQPVSSTLSTVKGAHAAASSQELQFERHPTPKFAPIFSHKAEISHSKLQVLDPLKGWGAREVWRPGLSPPSTDTPHKVALHEQNVFLLRFVIFSDLSLGPQGDGSRPLHPLLNPPLDRGACDCGAKSMRKTNRVHVVGRDEVDSSGGVAVQTNTWC